MEKVKRTVANIDHYVVLPFAQEHKRWHHFDGRIAVSCSNEECARVAPNVNRQVHGNILIVVN